MSDVEPIDDLRRRLLADAPLTSRHVTTSDGKAVRVLEGGAGDPLVLFHGTGNEGLVFVDLIRRLEGRRIVAVDRPGHGLSDPSPVPREQFREARTAWVGDVLDALGIERAALLGFSMGGLWSTWFALDHPERVDGLVLMGGVPGFPWTTVPLPFRVLSTPGLGALVNSRPSTRESVLQFAQMVGERESLASLPDMLDLVVASDADEAARAEAMALIPPLALLTRRFRSGPAVTGDELSRLEPPTLVVWGERDPVGEPDVARRIASTIPNARLELLDAGHIPWFGHPDRCADVVNEFLGA